MTNRTGSNPDRVVASLKNRKRTNKGYPTGILDHLNHLDHQLLLISNIISTWSAWPWHRLDETVSGDDAPPENSKPTGILRSQITETGRKLKFCPLQRNLHKTTARGVGGRGRTRSWNRDVRRGVSKGVEEGCRPYTLRAGHPWNSCKVISGCDLLTGFKSVEHGGPGWNSRESMATPCHTPMIWNVFISRKTRFSKA
jgi:hypothetical protein